MPVYLRGRVYGREHINFRNDSLGFFFFWSAQREAAANAKQRRGIPGQRVHVVPKRYLDVTTSPKRVGEKTIFFKRPETICFRFFITFVRKSVNSIKMKTFQKTTGFWLQIKICVARSIGLRLGQGKLFGSPAWNKKNFRKNNKTKKRFSNQKNIQKYIIFQLVDVRDEKVHY